MSGHLRSFSKQTIVYGGGLLLKRAVGFFMIPIYTRYLTPSDYGLLEILDLTGFIAAFFIGFGILQAVYRFSAAADDAAARRRVLTSAILTVVLIGGSVTALLALAAPSIARLGAGDVGVSPLVVLLLGGVFFGQIVELILGYFRVEGRPIAYTAYSLGSTVLQLSLNILFLVVLGLGVRGILFSTLLSSAVLTLILVALRGPGGGWTLDVGLIRGMLAYCVPFIPMGLMAFTVNFSDRYFLRVFADMTAVGVYALGYKLGMIVGFVVGTPFHLVWSAQAFEIAKSAGAATTYRRIFTYYALALAAVCASIAVMAREIVAVIASPEYAGAADVIPVIALSILLLNAQDVLQIGILLEKKTTWLPTVWAGTTAINIGLNFLLIPTLGMMGAAWSTLAAFAFQACASWAVSNRLYPIRYEVGRLTMLGLAGGAAYAASRFVGDVPLVQAVAIKLAILLGAGLVLLAAPGFVQADERAFVSSAWSRAAARFSGRTS